MTFILAPKVTANIISANTRAQNSAQRALVIAAIGTGATGAEDILHKNVPDPPFNDELGDYPAYAPEKVFGEDSPIVVIIRKFREINKVTPIDVIAVASPESSAVNSQFTVVGTAGSDGILTLQVGSPDYEYTIAITAADTATVVATAIETAINADSSSLVAVQRTIANIELVPKYTGRSSRNVSAYRITEVTASGFSFDNVELLSPAPASFDYPGLLDPIGNTRYQTIICPFADYIVDHPSNESGGAGISDILASWWNANGLVRDTMVFGGYTASRSGTNDPVTNILPTFNQQQFTFFTDISPDFDTLPLESLTAPLNICNNVFDTIESITAKFAAIRALRLTDGESVVNFVDASNGPLDSFGGPALASKPYFNMPVPGITLVNKAGYGFSQAEQEALVAAGGWTIGANRVGSPITGEVPTTYLTDTAGNADISFKYLNYVDTISSIREYFHNNLRSRFAQSRLTTGDVVRGRDMANEETIAAYCEILYQDLSGPDFVLVETGSTAFAFFKSNLIITIDTSIGRATLNMKVPIVTQLREILATIQLSFGTEG